jgi:hypothetical protein
MVGVRADRETTYAADRIQSIFEDMPPRAEELSGTTPSHPTWYHRIRHQIENLDGSTNFFKRGIELMANPTPDRLIELASLAIVKFESIQGEDNG